MTDDDLGYDSAAEQNIDYPFEEVGTAGDENRIRGNWSSKTDYFLSVFGYIFALGNLWRFPQQIIIHGGVAYFIPYTVMFFVIALPLMFMELSLGQFINLGPVSVWKMSPLFKGIGISMVFISTILAVYFNVITAWALLYLMNSMKFIIPWASCNNPWNTITCSTWNRETLEMCRTLRGRMVTNGTCIVTATIDPPTIASFNGNITAENATLFLGKMTTTTTTTAMPFSVAPPPFENRTLPSLEYFHNILMISSEFLEFHLVNWHLAICMVVAWLFVFVCSFRGVKTSGKVVYFTVLMPLIAIAVLLVRLLTLPGSLKGILFFFNPNWNVLRDFKVWGDAAVQIFYSLSLCTGGLTTLSSYNRFHNNVFADIWIFGIFDFFMSLSVSTLFFAAVGFVCYEIGIPLHQFELEEGLHLAFVFFAEALSKIPVAQLYSLLFFGMVALVMFNSVLFIVQTIVSSICDEFPERLRRNNRHVLICLVLVFYLLGLPLCTSAGIYWILLLEKFTTTWPLIIIAFFEVMVVCWIYGTDNFMDNIKWMTRFYPPIYIVWRMLWKIVCPIGLMTILAFIWKEFVPMKYHTFVYPHWSMVLGWVISFSPLAIIVCTALYKFTTSIGSWSKGWRDLLCPQDDWGPALAVHRAEVYPMRIPEARKLMQMRPYYSGDYFGSAPIGVGVGNNTAAAINGRYGGYKNPVYENNIFGGIQTSRINGVNGGKYSLAPTSDRETII